MAGLATRMYLLQYGAEPSPKSISVRGGPDHIIWPPVVGVAVDTTDGWVLLEAGFSRRFLDDAGSRQAIYASEEQPWALAGEPIVAALGTVGLRVADLTLAAVSHLHVDHAGGVAELAAAGIDIVVHKDELAFALHSADMVRHAYYRPDYDLPGVRWRTISDEQQIAPGVSVLCTPGHTPGHLSYRVDLRQSGTWLFAVDAADLCENINERIPPGWCADPADATRAEASLARLLHDAEELDARLIPCHDQALWRALRHPDGGWR